MLSIYKTKQAFYPFKNTFYAFQSFSWIFWFLLWLFRYSPDFEEIRNSWIFPFSSLKNQNNHNLLLISFSYLSIALSSVIVCLSIPSILYTINTNFNTQTILFCPRFDNSQRWIREFIMTMMISSKQANQTSIEKLEYFNQYQSLSFLIPSSIKRN